MSSTHGHSHEMDPEIAAILEEERRATRKRDKYLPKAPLDKGTGYLIRLIQAPVTEKVWFVRLAQHWVDRKPYFCPTKSGMSIGGDPKFECKACAHIDDLLKTTKGAQRDKLLKCESYGRYSVFGVIFSTENSRGRVENAPVEMQEELHEIPINQFAFETLVSYYQRGLKKSLLSIFDPVVGCDIWVRKGADGKLALDREDPAPISNSNPDAFYKSLVDQFKTERYSLPSDDEMEEACDKIDDFVFGGRGGDRDGDRGGGRGNDRGGGGGRDSDRSPARGSSRGGDQDDRPAARGSRSSEPVDDQRGGRGREPVDERPARGSSRSDPVDDRPAPRQESRTPAREQVREPAREPAREPHHEPVDDDDRGGAGDGDGHDDGGDPDADNTPPPPARRGAAQPPPAPGGAPVSDTPRAGGGSRVTDTTDEDEGVTHERRDAAPPVREDVGARAPASSPRGTPPPASQSRLSESMRSRLKVNQD